MSNTKVFHLPDLGEGLPDATIVDWSVKEGDVIRLDEPLVSMETAKAVVEVPSPYSGRVTKLHGRAGDVIDTGAALVEVELDPTLPQRAEAESTGHHHAPKAKDSAPAPVHVSSIVTDDPDDDAAGATAAPSRDEPAQSGAAPAVSGGRSDAGTVVGAMEASDRVVSESATTVGGVKAMPAVRALAKKLGVDLARVRASGTDSAITLADVKSAAAGTTALLPAPSGRATGGAGAGSPQRVATSAPAPVPAGHPLPAGEGKSRTAVSASGAPMRTSPPGAGSAMGQPEQLKGVRRNMARVMADAHSKVVPTTLCDDADLGAWSAGNDITVRLIRALVRGCKAVPALNAWFDGEQLTRTLHPHVDIGIAVDTEDGLFVPALRNADVLDARGVRLAVNRLRETVQNRTIPAEELRGYTISLSNFGVFAGRYATPVVVPPCVAIVAAGKLRHELVPVMGGVETHRMMPISLTFDHRAATGGEAARFLKAMLDDLALAE